MRTGKASPAPRARRRPPRGLAARLGFTYVALLAILALLGAALAALGTAWTTAKQRENERELQFRGEQIRDAIGRYRAAAVPPELPPTLGALLEDRRGPQVRHHLRRLWPDPFTRRADWVLIYGPEGSGGSSDRRIAGVRSRSDARRMSLAGAAAASPDDPKVADWVFMFAAEPTPTPTLTPSPADSTASAPGL